MTLLVAEASLWPHANRNDAVLVSDRVDERVLYSSVCRAIDGFEPDELLSKPHIRAAV